MRAMLLEHGLTPRPANRLRGRLLADLSEHGTLLEPTVAAVWEKTARPADSVRNWASKDTMGGIIPPASVKAAILQDLEEWAAQKFGSLEAEIVSKEKYVLEGVRLANKKKPAQ